MEETRERNIEPESDTEEALKSKDIVLGRDMGPPMPRDGSLPGGAYSQESPYIQPPFPMYSHEPPRARPQYMPPQPAPPIGVAGGYYPPPPSETFANARRYRGRRDSWDDDEDYYSDSYRQSQQQSRRPRMVTRRSSSYHGPRGRRYDDSDSEREQNYGALMTKRGKTPSGSEHVDKARDKAHRYKLKEEIEGSFTKSKAGLGGAAVGAVVAGWAASKAQVGYQKDGGRKDPNPLVTLLGAAVGGLAVNAIVEKYEESKRDTDDKQDAYNEKWGVRNGDTRSEGGKSQRSQGRRNDRGRDYGSDTGRRQRSQRRRDSAYGSDGYD